MAWLSGWTYRKEITVTDNNAAYQTKILVAQDAVDGEDVDCENHVAADFDDLRFTKADGSTVLPYWIEEIDGNVVATIWVKNTDGEATLYMYYGGTETAVTDGAATFIVFDDFERGGDGDAIGGNWTIATGDVDISDEQAYGGTRSMKLIGDTTSPDVSIPVTHGDAIAIRWRMYKENASQTIVRHGDGTTGALINWAADEDIDYHDGAWQDTGSNCTADQWELCELNNLIWASDTYDIIHNGVKVQDDAGMRTNASFNDVVAFLGWNAAFIDTYIDDFIVRKWSATEPSFAFGSETTESAFIPRITGII